ncbi:MAG: GNAT family N-acetyltransferase [Desulfobacterota bacterium]|jgi:RimJ/RimL family protein N-acetyltransferase|nr:GNAT family N-acetyltransferase [Thermodesulfobacteriota bacterium]
MGESDKGPILLRRAAPEDCDKVWQWRNHPSVRRFSIDPGKINLERHREWFQRVLKSRKQVLLIALRNEEEVGVLRLDFDEKARAATLSIYVKPGRHHRGIGTEMMKAGEGWLREKRPSVRRVVAMVRRDNAVSARLFSKAGFRPVISVYSKTL